jgi:rubrerythrin
MAKTPKIIFLLKEKQKIEKEIANLQKECKHSIKSIKFIKEHVDFSTFIVRWVCDNCNYVVGVPNPSELDNFLK